MTYAYLFKYIIIGDTGNPRATALIAGAGNPSSQSRSWGRGHLVGWAVKCSVAGGGAAGGGAPGRGSPSSVSDAQTLYLLPGCVSARKCVFF